MNKRKKIIQLKELKVKQIKTKENILKLNEFYSENQKNLDLKYC